MCEESSVAHATSLSQITRQAPQSLPRRPAALTVAAPLAVTLVPWSEAGW